MNGPDPTADRVLVLGGGLAGFVIGHSTADDDAGFRPDGFSNQGPGGRLDQQGPPAHVRACAGGRRW